MLHLLLQMYVYFVLTYIRQQYYCSTARMRIKYGIWYRSVRTCKGPFLARHQVGGVLLLYERYNSPPLPYRLVGYSTAATAAVCIRFIPPLFTVCTHDTKAPSTFQQTTYRRHAGIPWDGSSPCSAAAAVSVTSVLRTWRTQRTQHQETSQAPPTKPFSPIGHNDTAELQ